MLKRAILSAAHYSLSLSLYLNHTVSSKYTQYEFEEDAKEPPSNAILILFCCCFTRYIVSNFVFASLST